MKKKKYAKPEVEMVQVNMESHLLDLSIPIGEGAGPGGGGQAKEFHGFEEDLEENKVGSSNLWDAWEE